MPTLSERSSVNVDLAKFARPPAFGRVKPGQQAGGTESAFFGKLDAPLLHLNCAFPQIRHVAICEVVYCRCLLLLLIRYYCSWLLSAVACCFLLLPIVLFTFPGFSLTSQNPSRMHDFPAISYCFLLFPIISYHFLHVMLFPAISCNRCVMLCPAVSCYFLRFPAISC